MHNGKKKTTKEVVYSTLGNTTSDITSNIEQKISQIPPYEDAGVSYKGKFKQIRAQDVYEVKNQTENSISVGIATNLAGLPAGTYSIDRGHETQNFIVQFVKVNYKLTATKTMLIFKDSKGDNSFNIAMPGSPCENYSFEVIPKLFSGRYFNVTLDVPIPANEFIFVTAYGWYEDL